jgi:hypothetical protein
LGGQPLLFATYGLDVAEWPRQERQACGYEPCFRVEAGCDGAKSVGASRGDFLNPHFVSIADFGLVCGSGENDKVSQVLKPDGRLWASNSP